jgi:hypothetical protein
MKLRTFNNQHGITLGPILFIIAGLMNVRPLPQPKQPTLI